MIYRLAFSILSVAALLHADTLILKNGSIINGRFMSGDSRAIQFSVGSQTNSYSLVDIESLRFSDQFSSQAAAPALPAPAPPAPAPPSPQTNSSSSQPPGPPSDSSAPYNPAPAASTGNLEIPSGTQVAVRLIDAVDSKTDRLGQTYRASVETPVVVNGQTLIPRGSDAVATLSDQQKSGRIEGRTMMTIALRSVSVNGQTYDLATSSVSKTSGSRGTKSGEVIGGTAALGAIIGALAGGGRGAAIGAVSGGAVGTAAQVATSGERVRIPSETVLTFALQNPIYISNGAY